MSVWTNINNIKKADVFNGLVLLVLATLPLKHNFNSIAVILLFCFAIYEFSKQKKANFSTISKLYLGIFGLCALSVLWSYDTKMSVSALSRMLSYLIIPLSFSLVQLKIKEKTLSFFAYFVAFVGLVLLTISVKKYVDSGDISVLFYHKLSSNLTELNAIYLSVFVAFSFFILLFKKVKSTIDYVSIAFLLFFLFLLSSKLVIASVVLFLVYAIMRKLNKKLLLILFGFLIVTLALTFFTKNIKDRFLIEIKETKIEEVLTADSFGDVYNWTGLGLRVFQQRAFIETLENPKVFILGYGLDAGQKKLTEIYKKYGLYHGYYTYNYHNQYIQTFSEIGFVGLLVLLSILFLGFKKAFATKDVLFLSFMFLIAMVFITESFAWRARGMVFFLTFLLIFDAKTNEKRIF